MTSYSVRATYIEVIALSISLCTNKVQFYGKITKSLDQTTYS